MFIDSLSTLAVIAIVPIRSCPRSPFMYTIGTASSCCCNLDVVLIFRPEM